MDLDARVREALERRAGSVSMTLDRDALSVVEGRVSQVRRKRRLTSVAAGVAIIGVVVIVGNLDVGRPANGLPGVRPPSEPSAPRFTSSVNHVALDYPVGWTATAATRSWTKDRSTDTMDIFRGPDGQAIAVSSQPIPVGWTEDRWAESYLPSPGDVAMPQCFPARPDWLPLVVGGDVMGGLIGEIPGCSFTEVVSFVNGRAYVFTAWPQEGHVTTLVFPDALFRQVLSTVEFGP